MFLHNRWYVAAMGHEIGRHKMIRRILLDAPVVMFRSESGEPIALEDRCCHRHAPLSMGKLHGDIVECPYHGWRYDRTGKCVLTPGQDMPTPGAGVRSFPIVQRYKMVWIWMGDPALADPASIEDFHWMDDPEWRAKGDLMHLEANYVLLVENLLDLSHLSFVHPTTLGTDKVAQTPMETEKHGNGVRVTRWIMDSPPPPFFQRAGGFAPDQHVDRWQIIDWTPAAFVRLDVGCAIAGTGAREGDRSKGISIRNLNMITPETENTTHYFWAGAHNFKIDQSWMTDLVYNNIYIAFLEDLDIIKAQQDNIDTEPGAKRFNMKHDAGGLLARRVLEDMVSSEQRAMAAE